MLHIDERVALPTGPGFDTKTINKIPWLYFRKGQSKRVNGKLKHDSVAIGKIVEEQDGFKTLIPNDHYYEFVAKTSPPNKGKVARRGRKPRSKTANTYAEAKQGTVFAFGYGLACHKLAKDFKIKPILDNVFGPKIANAIIAAASYLAKAHGGLSGMEYFTSKHMLFTDSVLSSQRLSDLYREITSELRDSFFAQWIETRSPVSCACYDVTSISSYSAKIPLICYGYNRDNEKLAQVNVGLFCSMDDRLPIFLDEYNGSINDFTNLPYVLNHLMDLGFKGDITLVTDGGFATKETLDFIRENSFNYIIGAPLGFYPGIKDQVINWRSSPLADGKSFDYDGDLITYKETTIESAGHSCRLIMYQSSASSYRERSTLSQVLSRAERKFSDINSLSVKQARRLVKEYDDLFFVRTCEDGSFVWTRNEVAINYATKLCGCFAIFCTRHDLSPQKILEHYRAKDMCEKFFDVYKNDIIEERTNVSSPESLRGKLFIGFIALILRIGFRQKLGEMKKKKRSNTLDTVLMMLEDIKCRKCENAWVLNSALSADQKEILNLLDLDLHYLDTNNSLKPS